MEPEVIFDPPQAVFPQQRDASSDEHLKILMMVRSGYRFTVSTMAPVLPSYKNRGAVPGKGNVFRFLRNPYWSTTGQISLAVRLLERAIPGVIDRRDLFARFLEPCLKLFECSGVHRDNLFLSRPVPERPCMPLLRHTQT